MKEFREFNKVLLTETLQNKHFPIFKSSQYTEGNLSLKVEESSSNQGGISESKLGPISVYHASHGQTDKSLPSMIDRTSTKPNIQLTESQFHLGGVGSIPEGQAKCDRFPGVRRLDVSSHAKDVLLGTTAAGVLLELDSTRAPVKSSSPRQGYINQTSDGFLVQEEKMGKNMSLSIHDLETSKSCYKDFLGQQLQNMTAHGSPPIRQTRLYHGLSELPSHTSVHGKETMRMCTAIDSGGPSKFSQTTDHIFIEENTNVNLSGGVEILRESISTNYKRKLPSKFVSFSPGFGYNLKQGVKLQSLDSYIESDGKEKTENVRCAVDLNNESSADTDTIDMDMIQDNCLTDVAPSVPNKDFNEVQKSPTSEGVLNSVNDKSRGRSPSIVLPDINLEIPPISSAVDGDANTSRTQSMDASDINFHMEHLTNLKYSVCANDSQELDPCSRWVKRLKPSGSNRVAHGTKSSKMVEASSHEKANKLFNKMLYLGKTSSEPKTSKSFGEEHVIDRVADIQKNAESSSVGLVKAGQGKTDSHAWIQRWCHNPLSSLQKQTAAASCESLSSKAKQHHIHNKQNPSIAAMALMEKAMSGLRQCEWRKEGSFMAWNA